MASLRSSTAARLPASRERDFLPSSALPAARAVLSSSSAASASASSSSPASRASQIRTTIQVLVREGEDTARSATGAPVRRYHALPASASRETLPALRATHAMLSSSPAATSGSSKITEQYDPVAATRAVEAGIAEVDGMLKLSSRRIKVAQVVVMGTLLVGGAIEYRTYRSLKVLELAMDKLEEARWWRRSDGFPVSHMVGMGF